jgi:formylglycine-generating enzyme required for sulfatase activity
VWEYCEDAYHADYAGAPEDTRAWTEDGEGWEPDAPPYEVNRGGSWNHSAQSCRSACRGVGGGLSGMEGFRPALGPLDP